MSQSISLLTIIVIGFVTLVAHSSAQFTDEQLAKIMQNYSAELKPWWDLSLLQIQYQEYFKEPRSLFTTSGAEFVDQFVPSSLRILANVVEHFGDAVQHHQDLDEALRSVYRHFQGAAHKAKMEL